MKQTQLTWLTFFAVFALSLAVATALSLAQPAQAAPAPSPAEQSGTGGTYAGSATCAACHKETHDKWTGTLHSQAFSSPIFQKDWVNQRSASACLSCHTTGFDEATGKYAEPGVSCESCHGPFQAGHPEKPMPITPDATLCARCHKTTTDEWRASKHGQMNINCESCHDSHSQTPRAASVQDLCGNCHKNTGESFTHGTHATAGLSCSDCHMATGPRTSMIGGLVATGHTFAVGSEACINCHKDSVHTRDTLVRITGQEIQKTEATLEELHKSINDQEQTIKNLEAQSTVRLYTGLMQGAIVGLITGGAAAWIVGRRIRVVEVEEND